MRTVLLILLGLTPAALAQTAAITAPPTTQQAPVVQTPEEFSPFGLKVTVPSDWKRLPEGQPDLVGRWAVLKPGSTTEAAAVVTIEISLARGRTAAAAGKELAKKFNGQADPDAELAGNKASRVTGEIGDAKAKRPLEALVARHEDFIYVLSAAGTTEGGMAHSQALQDLRQGFEFAPVASPTEHMELRAEPFSVFQRFSIKAIGTLRLTPDQRSNLVQMRVFNYRRSRPDLVVIMELVPVTAGATLEAIGTEFATRSGAKKDDINWKELPGTPRRVISGNFKIGNRTMPVRIGLVKLSDNEVAIINFGLATPDDYDRVLYETKSEEMLRSIELLKK
jgi:hypothetical protein